MIANARARFSGGVLHPLEPLDLAEGEEVLVSIQAIPLRGSEEAPVQHLVHRDQTGRGRGRTD